MRPTDIRLPGAVDLSAFRRPATPPPAPAGQRGAPTAPGAAGAPGGVTPGAFVIDVTEASFEAEVINRSMDVPVVIDFWADWCGPCKQLSPVLESLAREYAGRWVLAKIDVDAEQRLGQAFQIQSIPSVMAVIGGRPLPLFQGALPEAQVRQYLDELLRVAAENGVTGSVSGEPGDAAAAPAGPPMDPSYLDAQDALDRGDLPAAVEAFKSVLTRTPNDVEAQAAIAQCEMLIRTENVDEGAARARAAEAPGDVAAQLVAADLEMVGGQVEAAIERLVTVVRTRAGDERDQARQRLLELFVLLEPEDPRLAAGRRALANALF